MDANTFGVAELGDTDGIVLAWNAHLSNQVGEKGHRRIQNADQQRYAPLVIDRDALPKFADTRGNGRAIKEYGARVEGLRGVIHGETHYVARLRNSAPAPAVGSCLAQLHRGKCAVFEDRRGGVCRNVGLREPYDGRNAEQCRHT